MDGGRRPGVLLVGLYSRRYAAIGESHGLSVIAGVLAAAPDLVARVDVLDMATYGEERPDRVVAAIRDSRPDVIGVAVPYGAYSVLVNAYPAIRAAADAAGARVVFGGALATYLTAELLDLDPAAVVVSGEGERPMLGLLGVWSRGTDDIGDVAGVTFRTGTELVATDRSLAWLAEVAPPFRDHVVPIARSGGQVYAESSRACSWAACTFCLRGLTDIDGRPREYRRFPAQRLAADLARLMELGIGHVVFADEDFLGHDLTQTRRFLDDLESLLASESPTFEFSTTIRSVFRYDDDRTMNLERVALLERLRGLGLRKVFLGIESGSDSQLRRYAKGHTAEECAAAMYRVRAAGLRLEVGFIMFDPLCTVDEIAENIAFIGRTGIVDAISAVTNELRLQQGARYIHVLERAERETGRRLYEREIDRDTLSHSYRYRDPDVARIIDGSRPVTAALQPITYPVKNVSRHGEGTPAADALRSVLADWKHATLAAIQAGIDATNDGCDPAPVVEGAMVDAGHRLATEVLAARRRLPTPMREHSVMAEVVARCRRFVADPWDVLAAESTVAR